MCRKKSKGGKLQDKWIGPYPIREVSRSTVRVCKDKALIRVKKPRLNSGEVLLIMITHPQVSVSESAENRVLSFNEDEY